MVRHYEMLRDANDYLRKHLSEAEKKKLSHVQAESLVGKILISSSHLNYVGKRHILYFCLRKSKNSFGRLKDFTHSTILQTLSSTSL
jgi:hypothetical protein